MDVPTGNTPQKLTIGDLDGDGKPDLVVTNVNDQTISVIRNTAVPGTITSGSFAAKIDFGIGNSPSNVAIGDFDSDGKPDLAVASARGNYVVIYQNTAVLGSITSSSFATTAFLYTGNGPSSVAIGDLDGDGKPDLVVTNSSERSVSVYRNIATSGSITTASFVARVNYTTGSDPQSVAIGDLDNDGKPDLAVTNLFENTLSVIRNTAVSGSITAASFAAKIDFATSANPYNVVIDDLDGDAKPDMAVANLNGGALSIYRNIGESGSITSGSFETTVNYATGSTLASVAIGDLDGDGKADLVFTNASENTVSVLRNGISAPAITSFSPSNGAVGSTVTITGSGFNATPTNNMFSLALLKLQLWQAVLLV